MRVLRWVAGLGAVVALAVLLIPGVRAPLGARLQAALLGPASNDGSVWQWVDEQGAVRFAASLDEIPESRRSAAGRIPMSAKRLKAGAAAEANAAPSSTARPASAPAARSSSARPGAGLDLAAHSGSGGPLTVYVSSHGRSYRSLVATLDDMGMSYRVVDIDQDAAGYAHVKELTAEEYPDHAGSVATPVIFAEGEAIFGDGPITARLARLRLDWVHRGRKNETPVMYMRMSCPYSVRLMEELDRIGQPYERRDIEENPALRDELVELTGLDGVPVTIVNGDITTQADAKAARDIQARARGRAPGVLGFIASFLGG